jgi:hypothetical protein
MPIDPAVWRAVAGRRKFMFLAGAGIVAGSVLPACSPGSGAAFENLFADADRFDVFGGGADPGVTGYGLFRVLDPGGLLVRLVVDLLQITAASETMVDGIMGDADIPQGTHMVTHPMLMPNAPGMHVTDGMAVGTMRRSAEFQVT